MKFTVAILFVYVVALSTVSANQLVSNSMKLSRQLYKYLFGHYENRHDINFNKLSAIPKVFVEETKQWLLGVVEDPAHICNI